MGKQQQVVNAIYINYSKKDCMLLFSSLQAVPLPSPLKAVQPDSPPLLRQPIR